MKKWFILVLALCMLFSAVPAFAETAESGEQKVPLIRALLADILEAAENGMEHAAVSDSGRMNIKGSVFSVLKQVVGDIKEFRASKEQAETEAPAGPAVNIKTTDEIKAMIAKMEEFLTEESKPVKEGEPDMGSGLEKVNFVLTEVYVVANENQVISDAIAASGSRLADMLLNNSLMLQVYLAEKGTATIKEDFPETEYALYETELDSLLTYIQEQDVEKKGQAIGLLNLIRALLGDVHTAIDGHVHGGGTAEESGDSREMLKMMMQDVLAAAQHVDIDTIATRTEGQMNISGGIFEVLELLLEDVAESRGLVEKTELEQLIGELKEMLENGKPAEDEEDYEQMLDRVTSILKAAYQAANSNEVLKKTIEETGSTLFAQILSGEPGTEMPETDEESFINGLKKEYETMQECIAGLDVKGSKRAAGVLRLIYDMFEDVRAALQTDPLE